VSLYFIIDGTTHTVTGTRAGTFTGYNDKASSLVNGKPFLSEAAITKPAFDSASEYLSPPADSYDYVTDTAIRIYSVIAKTQDALDQEQLNADTSALNAYGKDTVLVLVQLVSKLLTDGVILSTDFDPAVKDAYLDIKVIADRIIANQ